MFRSRFALLLLIACLGLTGCDSAEERAEEHYQSALALMEEGDVDRALVELRNVFDLNGFHKEARLLYADTILARGQVQEAYGQYLRLIEQYPDTLPVRLTLVRLALAAGDWDAVQRHGQAAMDLAPDDPQVEAIAAALAYRDASLADDNNAKRTAANRARAVLEIVPDNEVARRILIDSLLTSEDPAAALPEIDRALEGQPEALDLQVAKFRLLAEAEDLEGTGAQLQRMYELFPDNQEVRQALIGWYMSQGDLDGAEELLRDLAAKAPDDPAGAVTVVQFLQQARGADAAAAELDRLIAEVGEAPIGDLYAAMRAALDFEAGEQGPAIAAIQTVLDGAEESDQTRQIRVMLARMLIETGNPVGARAEIEKVLTDDAGNVEALKMRAGFLIEEDRPGEAINDLRAALDQAPRDPDILTLMAQAHERDGSLELAGERLALAVEVSDSAPEYALRYVRFLVGRDQLSSARSVLETARRASPGNIDVLSAQGDLALREEDWPSVNEVARAAEALGTDAGAGLAETLRTSALAAQGRTEETVAALEAQIAEGGDAAARATAMLVLTRVRADDLPGARAALDQALGESPDTPALQMLDANLALAEGDADRAETVLRDLIDRYPAAKDPLNRLYGILSSTGRSDEASTLLDAALEREPQSRLYRALKAQELEAAGDIDGAIELYEALYQEDTSNVILANNLASLIATYREDDPAELERAAVIARRLRGREIPAFQDTYGWIEYRRGNIEDAVASLEPAAAGLPGDPLVQFHLGMVYAAAGRNADARTHLELALELAGDSPLPQFETARDTLAGLAPADN